MTDHNGQLEEIATGRVVIASWPRMLTVELLAAYIGLAAQTVRNNADRIPGRRNLVAYSARSLSRSSASRGGEGVS